LSATAAQDILTPVIDVLNVSNRSKVLKGEAFESCVRVLRLVLAQLVTEPFAKSKFASSAAICTESVALVQDVLSARSDSALLSPGINGGVDCMRTRALFVFGFALIDYLEGSCVSCLSCLCTRLLTNSILSSILSVR